MMTSLGHCPVCECTETSRFDTGLIACRACGCVQQAFPRDVRRRSILLDQNFEQPDSGRLDTADRIVAHLESFVTGRRLFDVGFGDGALLRAAANRAWEVAGCDVAPASRACAAELGATATNTDYFALEDRSKQGGLRAHFDVVSFLYSLEQLDDAGRALRLAHDLLDENGAVCIELVPLTALRERSGPPLREQLPVRVLFAEAEHVRELLWHSGFRILEESEGVGWRWIARRN